MKHQNHDSETPTCPGCRGKHYPAVVGFLFTYRVWCGGKPALPFPALRPWHVRVPDTMPERIV